MKQRTPGSRDSAHCPRPHRSSVTSCPVSEPPSYQHYTAPVAQACDGIIALVLGCCASSQVGFRGSAGGGGVARPGLTRLSCFSAKLVFRATKGSSLESPCLQLDRITNWRSPSSVVHGAGTARTCPPRGTAWGCFHRNVNFERKVKGASALYCVYIKVLYVFITLIIVIKSLPFLICGLGKFCLFFLFGGFVCCLFFWAKKKNAF